MDFISALISIIIIDLVLAGDNAVVIAMAANRLPAHQRNKAIYFGTAGAIVIRTLMTLIAVWLLTIPYLQAIGGAILIPVAYKLLAAGGVVEEHVESADNLASAIKTILIADAAMGIDNVLAVAGAAHGSFTLVILGLIISIPIVVYGSKLIGKMLEKYPVLIYIGSGILAWTAGGMIMNDGIVGLYLSKLIPMAKLSVPLVITALVLGIHYFKNKSQ